MAYQSTRGSSRVCSFENVLLQAYADDGGLYLPQTIPRLSPDELARWSSLSYVELCKEIVKKFVDEQEYKGLQIDASIDKAFSSFDCKEVIPMKKVGDIFIAELWHGQSLAFKDLAVGCLGCIIENYLKQRNIHANVICATSGDTGSSVMLSVKGCKFIDVFTLFPEGRCSEIQERQMTCISEENIHAFSTQGTSDDFDVVVKEIFSDEKFTSDHMIISFSSLNWVRIMIQIVHYFYSYFQSVDKIGDLVSIVVPSGGLGNLTGGYIAYSMGLPIKLITAVNQNDSAHKILSKGIFSQPSEVLKSSSCSMDITVPYNIERILYLASGRDSQCISQIMNEYQKNKKAVIPDHVLIKMREAVQSASVSEELVKEAISEVWKNHGYHIEPHTAVAMAVSLHPERFGVKISGGKVICLSCASPQKFPEIFQEQSVPFEIAESVAELLKKPTRFQSLKKGEDWIQAVKSGIIAASEKFKNIL